MLVTLFEDETILLVTFFTLFIKLLFIDLTGFPTAKKNISQSVVFIIK